MAVVAATIFAGCATLEKSEVSNVEGLLTKAGFQKQVADTPQKLAHLKTLAQHQFSRHKRHGKSYVVYRGDPEQKDELLLYKQFKDSKEDLVSLVKMF